MICTVNKWLQNSQVEINPEVYKQLRVNRAHFMHSLEHDVQPAFGANIEDLNDYLLYGVIPWSPGNQINEIKLKILVSLRWKFLSHCFSYSA